MLFASVGVYNNLVPFDRTSYLLIKFSSAMAVLLVALLFFVSHMGLQCDFYLTIVLILVFVKLTDRYVTRYSSNI